MVRPGTSPPCADGGTARRGARSSPSTALSRCRTGRVLARPAAEPRRARSAGVADATRPSRSATVSSSADGPFQIRGVIASGARTKRRCDSVSAPASSSTCADLECGSAVVRKPRQLSAPDEGARGRRRLAHPRRSPAASPTVRQRRVRTGRTKIRSARTCTRAENYLSLVGFVVVDSRRHRRVERDARVRPAEAPQRRDPQVHRRIDDAGARHLRAPGRAARAGGESDGRADCGRRHARHPGASLTTSFGGLSYGLTGSAVAQGLRPGRLVSVLFALVPLLDVRRMKPLLLIRGTDMGQVSSYGRESTAVPASAPGQSPGWPASTGCRSARRSLSAVH